MLDALRYLHSIIRAMHISKKLLSIVSVAALAACSSAQTPAETPAPAAAAPATTALVVPAAQAQRGQNAFLSSCTTCHSSSEFSDSAFQNRWRNRSAYDLFDLTAATMPEDAPNSLPAERYVEIVAYLLRLNGFEPSDAQGAWSPAELRDVSLTSLGGG